MPPGNALARHSLRASKRVTKAYALHSSSFELYIENNRMSEKIVAEDVVIKKSGVLAHIHAISVASGIWLASLITHRRKYWSQEGE